MSDHLAICDFCGQGQIGLWTCPHCSAVVALCDECELVWADPGKFTGGKNPETGGSFDACPHCRKPLAGGHDSTATEISKAGFDKLEALNE